MRGVIPTTEPFPFPALPPLPSLVDAAIARIPRGRVTSYGRIARALGDPAAARWVGAYLLRHPHAEICRCHRVLRADGAPGPWIAGSPQQKIARLAAEGVPLEPGGRAQVADWFEDFPLGEPLARLRDWQGEVAARGVLASRGEPRTLLGLDVSYRPAADESSPALGVAAACLYDLPRGAVLATHLVEAPVAFPYISTYLAFRELPLLLAVVEEAARAGDLGDALLVDGSGLLHPRRGGIATLLGVLLDRPAIGLTKKLLCGRLAPSLEPAGPHPIHHDGRILGAALLPKTGSGKPLYVSPGHLFEPLEAARVVSRCFAGHRLPEPLHQADRLSRRAARSAVPGVAFPRPD